MEEEMDSVFERPGKKKVKRILKKREKDYIQKLVN